MRDRGLMLGLEKVGEDKLEEAILCFSISASLCTMDDDLSKVCQKR